RLPRAGPRGLPRRWRGGGRAAGGDTASGGGAGSGPQGNRRGPSGDVCRDGGLVLQECLGTVPTSKSGGLHEASLGSHRVRRCHFVCERWIPAAAERTG